MIIAHLRDVYLKVTFIHHYLIAFSRYRHIVLCRKIKDREVFPFKEVYKTSLFFFPLFLLDQIFTNKIGFKIRPINDWQAYKKLINKINGVNILHAHMGLQGVYAIPLAKSTNIPLVVTFYGADMSSQVRNNVWKLKYEELFGIASLILVEGIFMREAMIKIGCPREKVKVSRIGIPVDKIQYNPRIPPNDNEVLKIFMCASFVPKKGFFDALCVVDALRKNGLKVQCHIVGDGSLELKIKKLISELALEEITVLYGRVFPSRIFEIANDCHVFFHPSKTDETGDSEGGAPTIILEMQAMGMPVISTLHADIPNIIPVQNHFLAEEGDVDGLLKVFLKLLENRHEWPFICQRGLDFVKQNHDNRICAEIIESYYDEILKQRSN
jgi:colanic acid/amylovoran biosynthesis glycosyltransferase